MSLSNHVYLKHCLYLGVRTCSARYTVYLYYIIIKDVIYKTSEMYILDI